MTTVHAKATHNGMVCEAEAIAARASTRHVVRTADANADDAAARRLADAANPDEQLPLDDWLNQVLAQRVALQATVTWPGMQDGYVDGGNSDSANPFAVIFWRMEPTARHCFECPAFEAGSPYDPPWVQGGNQLNATPGDGHTECGAACKCSLEYGSAPQQDFRPVWGDPANAPPAPPPPSTTGSQPGTWPTVEPPTNAAALEEAQIRAMDAYRLANERWEAIRGALPALPDMFAADSHGANWPAWEAMSPVQRLALKAVFDALSAFERASGGALPLDQAVAENAAAQAELTALEGQLTGMADHLDDFVNELNAASDQDWQELFGKRPLHMFLWQLQQDFEAVLDWFYNRTPPKGMAEADGAAGVRLSGHEPGYAGQGHGAHGHWLPGEGGEGESSGGGGHGPAERHIGTSMRHRGHPPNTPAQREAAKERQRAAVRAHAAAKRAERYKAMSPEERAAFDKRSAALRAPGKGKTPEERRDAQRTASREHMARVRAAERVNLPPEVQAVQQPHIKVGTPGSHAILMAHQAQLKAAWQQYKERMVREHADARTRVTDLRTRHAEAVAKLQRAATDGERATLREHLRGIVEQHNTLVTWMRENPIPTELSEPNDDMTRLLSGHLPGYQQNRQAGGKFGVGNGPQESGSGGSGGHGGGGSQTSGSGGLRAKIAGAVNRLRGGGGKAPKPAYPHVARDAQGNPIKAGGGAKTKGGKSSEEERQARVKATTARRKELDATYGRSASAKNVQAATERLFADYPEVKAAVGEHLEGARTLSAEHAAEIAARRFFAAGGARNDAGAIAHAHEGFAKLREISEWSLLHHPDVTAEGTIRMYRGESSNRAGTHERLAELSSDAPRRSSPWSTDRRVAATYAHGRTWQADVPVSTVLMWHGMHGDYFHENEFTVNSGALRNAQEI